MPRYKLRTLLIVLALGPPFNASVRGPNGQPESVIGAGEGTE